MAPDDNAAKIAALLHEASETHHTLYRITDGADDDWASFYSDWLVNLSELPDLLVKNPVRSELTFMLVRLAREYGVEEPDGRWEDYYAARLVEHFAG